MVPKWVRGRESLDLVGAGTPVAADARARQLDRHAGVRHRGRRHRRPRLRRSRRRARADVKGNIVLFNVPFTNYGETVALPRATGRRAPPRSAPSPMLLRSVGPTGLRTPHTGATIYDAGVPQIPAAAISAEDADRLQRLQDRGVRFACKLSMEAHFEPDAQSYNVVGELRGREICRRRSCVVGGHFDSWDVGTGASDDGGGCIATWEALRLMKKLDLRPRRTVRVVLFTNEENGGRGGTGYRDAHQAELANHVLLLESDGGVFDPAGFGFTGPDAARRDRDGDRRACSSPSAPTRSWRAGGGADIEPSGTSRQHPDDVARRQRRLLPDPPHAGRHDRAHHAEAESPTTPRRSR